MQPLCSSDSTILRHVSAFIGHIQVFHYFLLKLLLVFTIRHSVKIYFKISRHDFSASRLSPCFAVGRLTAHARCCCYVCSGVHVVHSPAHGVRPIVRVDVISQAANSKTRRQP
jgi:hypothetical protein